MGKLFNLLYKSDEDRRNFIRIAKNLFIDGNSAENSTLPNALNLDISNHRVISDKRLISLLLSRISEEQTPVYIKSNSNTAAFPFTVTSIDTVSITPHIRLNRSNHTDDYDFSDSSELILFFHDQSIFYMFKTTSLRLEPDNIYLALPQGILQLWRRPHPKSRIGLEDRNIQAKILTGKNEEYAFPVNDIGYRGLSLNLPDRNTAKAIEQTPVKISVNIDDVLDISFEACLKYMDEKLSAKSKILKCGFEITSIDTAKRDNLRAFIFKRNYPYIVPFHVKHLDKIWELFFKSGYMIPEKKEYVKKVKREIEDTWVRLYEEQSKIGKMLLFMDNDELFGTIATALAYENTWIIHQVAGLNHPEFTISKYILESMTALMIEQSNIEYAKVYFRKENNWAIRKFYKLHEFRNLENAILYAFLDLYEIDINKYKYFKSSNLSLEIDYLSSTEDRLFITDYLIKTLPELLLNTESINNFGLELPVTSVAYGSIGLFRGRKILIAKENKRIISFALLEYGSTGINIGGLLDVFQIFTVEPSNENLNIINRILINEIIDFYLSIGKKSTLCLTDDINKYVLEAAGFTKKLDYVLWYSNNDSFKQIAQYFCHSHVSLKGRHINK